MDEIITIEIKRDTVKHAIGSVHDTIGLTLTDQQFLELCTEFGLLETLSEWGADTEWMGFFASKIAKKLIGRTWPTYGKPDPTFFGEFYTAAQAAGYVVGEGV